MAERDVRERDILVATNEYAYVQDLTKGDIVLYVGPTKISLSNTERLVDFRNDRFVPVRGDDSSVGVSAFVSASSSQYIIIDNPTKDPTVRALKGSNAAVELQAGRKVVVPGPATFPLWPGQKARVIQGHSLREDEYLLARVYDKVDGRSWPIGTDLIVKGSDVSFYIPATGLEVLAKDGGGYVRRAWRLRKSCGLHLRVIQPFVADEHSPVPSGSYTAGQEIFLADREGFFFPTAQLEVLGVVTPIPISDKEGIYVRHLETGRITTVSGPCNYLLDPTQWELVTRSVAPERTALYGLAADDEGQALSIYVPPSFAVLVTAKNRREVVKGPVTRILDFDEELEVLQLSTGRPKTEDAVLATCLLQVEGNKVSDLVRVKTADHVELELALSYRVSFVAREAEPPRWFNVRNYVGLLCDHLASLLRAVTRGAGIETLHANGAAILRTAILGEKSPDGPREGRYFEENGMWVYDVEVLEIRILDDEVRKLLAEAQRTAIVAEVRGRQEQLRLAGEQLKESVDRQIAQAKIATLETAAELESARGRLAMASLDAAVSREQRQRVGHADAEAQAHVITSQARLAALEKEVELERRATEARVAAFKEQMSALQPELVSTLRVLGNQQLAAELTRHASPLAILGGESVVAVVGRLLDALPIGPAGASIRSLLASSTPEAAPSSER